MIPLTCCSALLALAGCGAAAQPDDHPNGYEILEDGFIGPVVNGPEYAATEADNFIVVDGALTEDLPDQAPTAPPYPDISAMEAAMEKVLREPPRRSMWSFIDAGLAALRGKPERVAFKRLGYPDRKMPVAGAIVYHWSRSTPNLDGGALHCKIKIVVRAGVVVDSDYDGNAGACEMYARRFGYTQ